MPDSPRTDIEPELDLRSFGRKRGRKLSSRQRGLLSDLLPTCSVDLSAARLQPRALFDDRVGEVWLEIGFGGAEHLVWQAQRRPDIGLIGCEPFEEGLVKALTAIEEQQLTNIRLYPGDARDVLRRLPAASLDRVFVLFPDPWPKRKHVKRRLVSAPTLELLARIMRPGSELRIATDIGDYARTMMIAFQAVPAFEWQARSAADWRTRPDDWPPTRYQAKAIREGRSAYFLRFVRREPPSGASIGPGEPA